MFDFPSPPSNGQTVVNLGVTYQWDGTKWHAVSGGSGGGGATITISDTPPANPTTGALWFDSVGAQTYLWFNDGTSSQWVPVNAPPSSSTQYLPISGGTMSGPLLLGADPATAMQAATKEYVDAGDANDATLAAENVGRNFVHNPAFTIAQRGAGGFSTNGIYTVDRWMIALVSDTVTFSQQSMNDAMRGQIGDETATNYLANVFTGNSASGAYNIIAQRIEGVRRLANKTVTVSFWANSGGTLKIGVNLMQFFGTGGSPSNPVWVAATGASFTTSPGWQRFSATFAIPSASGKTFGTTANTDYTQLAFWYSCGTGNSAIAGNIGVQSGQINLWGVQLEIGSTATPLDYGGSPADQLRQCQRFFISTAMNIGGYSAVVGAVLPYGPAIYLPVTMRAGPTVTLVGTPAYTNASALVVSVVSAQNYCIGCTVAAAGNFLASCNPVTFSADL